MTGDHRLVLCVIMGIFGACMLTMVVAALTS